jgi:tetratricopeptide (TPR) repeat protein
LLCKNNRQNHTIFFSLLLFLTTTALFSQETPSWIMLEKGKSAFEQGELGLAHHYFQQTLQRGDLEADGYTWLGKVYDAEGEFKLAEEAYRNAIKNERTFYVWEDRFTPRTLLAAVLEKMGEREEAIEVYHELIEMSSRDDPASLPSSFLLQNFLQKRAGTLGYIDKFLELYRPKGAETISSHGALARLYRETGDLEAGKEHYLMAIMIPLSLTIDIIRSREPGYIFISDQQEHENTFLLIRKGEADEQIASFFQRADLYENMYNFAHLLSNTGYKEAAEELLLMVSSLNGGGIWQRRASQALAGSW